MKRSLYSSVLVCIQFAAIAYFLVHGKVYARHPLWQVLQAVATLLGLVSIAFMRLNNLRIAPEPRKQAVFIRQGPYRYIRHPMYLAVLLFCLALLLDRFSVIALVVYILLLANLLLKIEFEERLLTAHFAEYAEYRSKTRKLIPLLY